MKKLLLILICLFVSSEVKSVEMSDAFTRVEMSECLIFFEKGRIIQKYSRSEKRKAPFLPYFKKNRTLFSYKGKSYVLTVITEIISSDTIESEGIVDSKCEQIDFDNREAFKQVEQMYKNK